MVAHLKQTWFGFFKKIMWLLEAVRNKYCVFGLEFWGRGFFCTCQLFETLVNDFVAPRTDWYRGMTSCLLTVPESLHYPGDSIRLHWSEAVVTVNAKRFWPCKPYNLSRISMSIHMTSLLRNMLSSSPYLHVGNFGSRPCIPLDHSHPRTLECSAAHSLLAL